MAQSRGKLIDELTDDITRTALGSADLGPEDRVLVRQRVQETIQRTATRAHGDVVALAYDSNSPEADRVVAHMDSSYQLHGGPDPAVRDSAAGRLAAELVASDDRTNAFHPLLRDRAVAYIAHSVSAAAVAEARKTPGGPSQAPAAAALGAAAGPTEPAAGQVPAAGPASVAAVAAVKAGVRTDDLRRKDGPSVG